MTEESQAKSEDIHKESIRVHVDILDNLMDQVGELVLLRNQFLRFNINTTTQNEFANLSQRLNIVTGEIQDQIMLTRMQPVGKVLTKFSRLVRDVAHSLDKKIELTLEGVDTELDKSLIEAVKDPLTHLVRNSCDHGIETPEQRTRIGKNPTGRIEIKSYHEGGQVIIEISDNGQGLNKEKLIAKALANNLITTSQSQSMSDREAYQLIFNPGLSTAENISKISGRGVGMDVVKSNIEAIGGNIELDSTANEGTKIKLKIPLTLAIMPALIIKSHGLVFSIPQAKLVELIRAEHNGQADNGIDFLQGQPVYRLRGEILPLISLNQLLGFEQDLHVPQTYNITVLKSDIAVFGLIVDQILDSADIVIKPLISFLKPLNLYSGATVMGDSSIALVLDVNGLAKSIQLNNTTGYANSTTVLTDQKAHIDDREYLVIDLDQNNRYAIQLDVINRLEEFSLNQIERQGDYRVVQYRHELLPIINLNTALDLDSPHLSNVDPLKKINIVVINHNQRIYGLEVGEITEVISSADIIDTSIRDRPGIMGNLIYQDQVYVVLDILTVVERADVYQTEALAG